MQNCGTCIANLQILGIDNLPTSEIEIKQAYRDGAKIWHPDRFQSDPRLARKAEEQFKLIQIAYEQLVNHADVHGNYGSKEHGVDARPEPIPPPRPFSTSPAVGPLLPDNVAGALAYITLLPPILLLILPKYSQRPFIRFHSFQCICLSACALALNLILVIPLIGWLVAFLGDLLLFGFWIVCILKAFSGERFKVPRLGDFAEKLADRH